MFEYEQINPELRNILISIVKNMIPSDLAKKQLLEYSKKSLEDLLGDSFDEEEKIELFNPENKETYANYFMVDEKGDDSNALEYTKR